MGFVRRLMLGAELTTPRATTRQGIRPLPMNEDRARESLGGRLGRGRELRVDIDREGVL
jgi:hypothetical protein